MKTVLFLCTGNYYRSRFAEYVFNHRATECGLSWRASSRALRISPRNVGPLSEFAKAALLDRKIPLEESMRGPISVELEDFERADRIVAVKEAEHRAMVAANFPTWTDRIEYWKIHDLDCATPDEALPVLEQHVAELMESLHS